VDKVNNHISGMIGPQTTLLWKVPEMVFLHNCLFIVSRSNLMIIDGEHYVGDNLLWEGRIIIMGFMEAGSVEKCRKKNVTGNASKGGERE